MGTWGETCAISNLPINCLDSGEDIVMVVFHKHNCILGEDHGTEMDYLRRVADGEEHTGHYFKGVFRGAYDSVGGLEDLTSGNDDQYPDDLHNEYIRFFVYGSVWDEVVARCKKLAKKNDWDFGDIVSRYEQRKRVSALWQEDIEVHEFFHGRMSPEDKQARFKAHFDNEDPYPKGQKEIFQDLLYVLRFMHCMRRNPWAGMLFAGCQDSDIPNHKFLHKITGNVLKVLAKEDAIIVANNKAEDAEFEAAYREEMRKKK